MLLFRTGRQWAGTAAATLFAAGVLAVLETSQPLPVFAHLSMPMCETAADQPGEAAFLAENTSTMEKMMADMAVKPSGDVDRDFVEMMIPHHQGAIEMATAELKHGGNEVLRRMAQEIIVTQQQEIAAMRMAVDHTIRANQQSREQRP